MKVSESCRHWSGGDGGGIGGGSGRIGDDGGGSGSGGSGGGDWGNHDHAKSTILNDLERRP